MIAALDSHGELYLCLMQPNTNTATFSEYMRHLVRQLDRFLERDLRAENESFTAVIRQHGAKVFEDSPRARDENVLVDQSEFCDWFTSYGAVEFLPPAWFMPGTTAQEQKAVARAMSGQTQIRPPDALRWGGKIVILSRCACCPSR